MHHALSKCKTLVALTTWVCVCVALLLVWPSLPTPAPPLPATSPRPAHTAVRGPPLPTAMPRPAFTDSRGRRGWRTGGGGGDGDGGGAGLRLYRRDEDEEEDEYEDGKHRIAEYYDDDDDGDDGDGGDGGSNDVMRGYDNDGDDNDMKIISYGDDGGDGDGLDSVRVQFNDGDDDAKNMRKKKQQDDGVEISNNGGNGDDDGDDYVRGAYSEGENNKKNMRNNENYQGVEGDDETSQYYEKGNDGGRIRAGGGGGGGGKYKEEKEANQKHGKNKTNKINNSKSYQSEYNEEEAKENYQGEYEEAEREGTRGGDQDRYEEEEEGENQDEYDDYEDQDGLGGHVEYTGGEYNVTPNAAHLLIYNRIPKCASSTMQTVLRWCSRRLGYEHISSLVYDQHQLSQEKQRELVNNLTAKTSMPFGTLSYDQHLYYTDFTAQGAERPVYINLVREPVERFISSFYYRRSKERLARILAHGHLVASPSPNWRNRTVEQCVLFGDAECSFTPGTRQEMVLTYFCGHQPSCRTVGSKEALQVAKQVVSEEYSVVGLVSHMEVSLSLMETLIPGYLTGALNSYHNIRRKEEKVNKNSHKPAVSKEVIKELRRRMAHDIDFYNFLKQRLFLQMRTFLGK